MTGGHRWMNIATICSEQGTWPRHLKRWLRYVKKSNPGADLYLAWAGGMPGELLASNQFKGVKMFPANMALSREWLNTVRMGMTTLFGVEDVLYVDCDADVITDLSDVIKDARHNELLCCRSTGIRPAWAQLSLDKGWGYPKEDMNNGLLWMSRDYSQQYGEAWKATPESVSDRIRGSVAFQIMMRDVAWRELPYEYGTVWSDLDHLPKARVIQWCNSYGQAKRLELEDLYHAVQLELKI